MDTAAYPILFCSGLCRLHAWESCELGREETQAIRIDLMPNDFSLQRVWKSSERIGRKWNWNDTKGIYLAKSSTPEWGVRREIAVSGGKIRAKKWRPQCVVKRCRTWSFGYDDNPLNGNILRFNPVQVAEWLQDLLDWGIAESQRGLEEYLGIDRTRVGQFLRLRRLPEVTQAELRKMPDLTEFQLRRVVGTTASMSN